MLKKVLLVILALVIALTLLALPSVVRWFYYHQGQYEPQEVARPNLDEIEAPTPGVQSFTDQVSLSEPGVVLVDLAHSNRLDLGDLSVLQARLSARGQRFEPVTAIDDLENQLSYAKALIVVSPGEDWRNVEIDLVERFVEKGGRLLLVADPTRYGVTYDEWDYPVIDGDVSHINDLAARFGLLFQDDYLYNTSDSAGNFRNIKLADFADHELTEGLEQVVFYAAHSIVSEEPPLLVTGGETRTSGSERSDDLAVAVLASEGSVLGLGDLSFMTAPYNAGFDNDQLIANTAHWLGGSERTYDLVDFPHYFAQRADLVFAGDPMLDSDLLAGSSSMQRLFATEGKELMLRSAEDGQADTIFFGLYEDAEEVESYLAVADVTLWITPSAETEESESETEEKPGPEAQPTIAPSTATTTTVEAGVTATVVPTPEITATSLITSAGKNHIEIEALGDMVVTSTALLLLEGGDERQVLVVLADTEKGLATAVDRLTTGNMEGCLFRESGMPARTVLALCPTGEAAAGDGDGGRQEPKPDTTKPPEPSEPTEPLTDTVEPPEPVGGEGGKIMVVALDHGEGRYIGMTSAEDYAVVLSEDYDVTVWSTAERGLPEAGDLFEYDLVIWSAGDFEDPLADEKSDLVFSVMLEGLPILLSGAFIGDTDAEAVQRDIEVADDEHPLASGFEAGEVVTFVSPPVGEAHATSVLEDVGEEEGTYTPFVRGPSSDETGAPSLFVLEDEFTDVRVVFAAFPVYLLPEKAKSQLMLNSVEWLLNPEP